MNHVESQHKPGLVGMLSGDLTRFPEWQDSMLRLLYPTGSTWCHSHGNGFAQQRNNIVKQLHQRDPRTGKVWQGEWVFFCDDDQPCDPDLLLKLLDRNVDIIQAFTLSRHPPYKPYAYRYQGDGAFSVIEPSELPESGIYEVGGCGGGNLLVRREVFEKMPYPWFEEGKTNPEHIGEDLHFVLKAKQLGFKAYIDLDNVSGHINTYHVWPRCVNGKWGTTLVLSEKHQTFLPSDHFDKKPARKPLSARVACGTV